MEASIESKGEEQDSLKDCCDYGELREKRKKIQEMGKGREKGVEVKSFEEKLVKYEKEISENASNIVDITDLRVNKVRLMSTVDEYGRQLAIKSNLIEKISKVIKNLQQEKIAFGIQVEEYEKEIC